MDLIKYAQSMGSVLKRHCDNIALLGEMDDDGAMWRFSIPVVIDDTEEDTVCGMISCETNEEDIGIPTVSISISLGEITGFSRENLLRLLAVNSDFYEARLFVAPFPDGSEVLWLGQRVSVEDFNPEKFGEYVADLVGQAMRFVPEELMGTYFSDIKQYLDYCLFV